MSQPDRDTSSSVFAESINNLIPQVVNQDKILISKFIYSLKKGVIDKSSINYEWFKSMVENHGSTNSKNFMKKYDLEGESKLTTIDCKEVLSRPSKNLQDTSQVYGLDFLVYACS